MLAFYILKSIDGGNTFSEVTPYPAPGAAAFGFYGMDASCLLSGDLVSALVKTNAVTYELIVSPDGGTSWVEKQAGLSSPVCLVRWPYDDQRLYFLQAGAINYSTDGGATLLDLTGDWASVMGAAFADPVAIVPIWTA